MVPSFFDVVTAKKILMTGKAVNFIRKCCNEEDWVLEIDTSGDLETWVD
jgi:hypothetical protein